MTNEEDDLFKYLSYVTLREGWAQIKGTFFGWLVISVIFIVIDVLIDFGASQTETFWAILPKPFWYVLGFAAFTWFVRGEEFQIVFPKSFGLWLLVTSAVALMVLLGAVLPTWAMMPVYAAVMLGFGLLVSLAEIGRENFQKLSRQPDNA